MAEPKTNIDIKTSDHEIRMTVDGQPFGVAWGPGVAGEWFYSVGGADGASVESRGAALSALLDAVGVKK